MWDDLETEPLCTLEEYNKFLNGKCIARLLGSPEFCVDNKYSLLFTKEKTPPAQQPDMQ
jgi:hypothetical protein